VGAVVLLSGGLDSAVALALAVKAYGHRGYKGARPDNTSIIGVNILYGQKHAREQEAARQLAEWYDIRLMEVNLPHIFEGAGSALIDSEVTTKAEEDWTEGPVSAVVPFRNANLLSVATTIALVEGADSVWFGAHAEDAAAGAFPDCSAGFIGAMAAAIQIGSNDEVVLVTPFMNWFKWSIVMEGIKLNVPFDLTWTCYKGDEKACGKCAACKGRLAAFAKCLEQDPIVYEDDLGGPPL
jgi:7-cyano-7-deazaguanine synthase